MKIFSDIVLGSKIALSVKPAGIDQNALVNVGLVHLLFLKGLIFRLNNHTEFQPVFSGEFKIPLIVGRHSHYSACSVFNKNKIGYVYWDLFTGDRIDTVNPGIHSLFCSEIRRSHIAVYLEYAIYKLNHLPFSRSPFDQPFDHRVFRRKAQKSCTEKGIRPCGKDLYDLIGIGHRKTDDCAVTLSYPVFLHGRNTLRPPGKFSAIFKDLLSIVGDFQKPAVHFPDGHLILGVTPAAAIFHLLICKDALAFFTPVDVGPFFIGKSLFIHLKEYQLFPPVIARIARSQFTIPVITETHGLKLRLHGLYVIIGPLGRMRVIFNGGIFSGQSKCVPSHGMKHVFAAHPFVSRDHISYGVVAHMTHVDLARGIRKHLKQVVFFP